MVNFSKQHLCNIITVFNEHRRLHFDFYKTKNNRRAFKAFRLNFMACVKHLGGTGVAAEEALRLHSIHYDDDTSSNRCLCVQYPFSRGLVRNCKKWELRKTKVPTTLLGKTVFINESKTTTNFESVQIPSSWRPAPGAVIGTALCTGSFKLDVNNITDETAIAAMLTKEGLQEACKRGYVHVWTFENGVDFRANTHNAANADKNEKTAQIVTVMNNRTSPRMFTL
jgi:hypothetical protein